MGNDVDKLVKDIRHAAALRDRETVDAECVAQARVIIAARESLNAAEKKEKQAAEALRAAEKEHSDSEKKEKAAELKLDNFIRSKDCDEMKAVKLECKVYELRGYKVIYQHRLAPLIQANIAAAREAWEAREGLAAAESVLTGVDPE